MKYELRVESDGAELAAILLAEKPSVVKLTLSSVEDTPIVVVLGSREIVIP